MRNSEQAEFYRAVALYLRVWDKKPDDQQLQMWWSALQDCNMADVRRAFDELLRRSRFSPKPADVVSKIHGEGGGSGGTPASARRCSEPGCHEPMVEDFGKPLCLKHSGSSMDWLAHNRWRLRLAAHHLLRQNKSEAEARAAYGNRAVDWLLNNTDHDLVKQAAQPPQATIASNQRLYENGTRGVRAPTTLAAAVPNPVRAELERREAAARAAEAKLEAGGAQPPLRRKEDASIWRFLDSTAARESAEAARDAGDANGISGEAA